MKQLLILSGKGGTGKTTVASAFIRLSDARAYADCDVDAPNLHLITGQNSEPQRKDYYGLQKAEIDIQLCTSCDLCRQNCRFDAIFAGEGVDYGKSNGKDGKYVVDYFACEGCGVCQYVCPSEAVSLKPAVAGDLMLYKDETKIFSTARLRMGSGNSGLLVTEVKKQMKDASASTDTTQVGNQREKVRFEYGEIAIIDGSPGIGCPVIASLSGVDMVLIVAEPSISGISDMERIIKTASTFGTEVVVCINKYDTNLINTERIESYCEAEGIPFAGKIPFDYNAVKAVNNGMTVVDMECDSGSAVKDVFAFVFRRLL